MSRSDESSNGAAAPGPVARPTSRVRVAVGLGAILVVGFALRSLYLTELLHDPSFTEPAFDAQYHDYWAWGMVSGDWSLPMGLPDPEIERAPYLRPPGYPFFLAAVYAVAGRDYVVARQAHFAVGLLSCLLAFGFGRRWLGSAVGLIFAAFMATYWTLLFFEGEFLEPVLLVPLGIGAAWALVRMVDAVAWPRAVLAGALLGLFALVRPNGLALVPVAAGWIAWVAYRRGDLRRAVPAVAALAVAAAAVVLPATVRNWRVSGEVFPVTANAGINLYIGNNPIADGASAGIPDIEELTGTAGWTCFDYPNVVRGLERRLGREVSYGEASRYWKAAAMAFIRENPARFLTLTAKRAALFWGPHEVGNNKDLHFARRESIALRLVPVGFPGLLATAFLGFALLVAGLRRGAPRVAADAPVRDRGRHVEILALVALFVGAYFGSFVFFFFASRYRAPLLPFLMLFGAYGLWRLGDLVLRERRFRVAAAWVAVWAVALLGARADLTGYRPNEAEWTFLRGNAFEDQGRLGEAIDAYRRTLALDPGHAVAHNNLGLALLKTGATDEGIAHLVRAVDLNPRDPNGRFNLGAILIRNGRFDEAVEQYRLGLERSPNDPYARINLGGALVEAGRPEEAIPHLEAAREILPGESRAALQLGRAHLALGRLDEAEAALLAAARYGPENAAARLYLGEVLEAAGREDEARERYREALAINPGLTEAAKHLGALDAGPEER